MTAPFGAALDCRLAQTAPFDTAESIKNIAVSKLTITLGTPPASVPGQAAVLGVALYRKRGRSEICGSRHANSADL